MDIGGVVVGLEGFVGSETVVTSSLVSDPETKAKLYGSGFLKQERPGNNEDVLLWRSSKLAKTEGVSASEAMPLLLHDKNSLLRSNANATTSVFSDGVSASQAMLSFSSAPKSRALSVDKSSQNVTFPYFHLTSPASTRNTGYNNGGFNGENMHGVLLGGDRGPFTPSQWMELEHQALIYKYITSNVPIPSNLLIPIRKALGSTDFSSFSGAPLKTNTLGWGAFRLGFSNNTDPEPGRCRRTDGKKWRCSRDAVADQKYCERHMNRGRHRSRKPVEGQSGHSAGATSTTTTKVMSTVSSALASVVVPISGCSESNSLTVAQQQFKNLQPVTAPVNRLLVNKETSGERLHESTLDLKSKENSFLMPMQQLITTFGSSQDLICQATESQHSLREFIDDWPKSQSDRSTISWPEVDVKSDMTQLSISIPMAASDFMSSTSSPSNEKLSSSPLRLSREFDTMHMGLGVGSVINEPNHKQANWIPISWENSMGGPLGEVLHSTNSSALNLITCDDWNNSHGQRLASSPTGVLTKTTFGSVSNSSAGSSPRPENDLLGSTLVHTSSLPAL
ncbi:growth-regulating factor 1 isoform X2 [Gossypium raimondii]|uniref:Growth-regulating factor n=1 Tax=Gossypium raimondii TaxID=29730 RepID=A0A0D2U7X7_GOSRA|nr:growth-regulating factor 1 isoform X2 [Gossypium raimondii]KJB63981.1 hypothetical protein B456_010G027700 [Gossypium raimondii]